MAEINITKIVGVVADVRRDLENDHSCSKCSVFGINKQEYDTISQKFRMIPQNYRDDHTDRYFVHCSPWQAMRILGENFGYALTVTPLHGRIESASGERRTCVWTMVSSRKSIKPNIN